MTDKETIVNFLQQMVTQDCRSTAFPFFYVIKDYKNDFSCADFLACVCANISSYPQNEFETSLFVAGHEFNIKIERKQNVCH